MGVLKVEQIFKGSLYSIPLPSPSLEIQITEGKVCLRCKTKKILTSPCNVFPLHLLKSFLLYLKWQIPQNFAVL